ncbi:hypothetical protein ACFV2H_08185 [Streptomyces sp. NPDC059629]|uniref:hypothetical protein n=1 Tax=Streptomyces sp. NPDC059629 TaxID=3346889 RepID=UPI003698955B
MGLSEGASSTGLLTAVVLLGHVLSTAFGCWWAGPAAGCALVCQAIREVREIFSGD